MAIIYSRQQFAEYCLRKLGAPVIEINVADEQVDDCIDEALQKFWEFHGDGAQKNFLTVTLTAQDIANRYITIPENIITIVKVLPLDTNGLSSVNLEYQFFLTEIMNARRIMSDGISGYVITQQYLQTMNEFFNREKMIRWNRYSNRLLLDTDWSTLKVGDNIVIEAYAILNPDDFDEVWNDMWLKAYATALMKRQWGQNMLKYDGFQLPSGITLNGRQLFDDANAEIQKLEDDLQNIWQLPIDFMVG
jgi:hypothetical protein